MKIETQDTIRDIVLKLSRKHTVLSLIAAAVMSALYFTGMITDVKSALPHVIIFSTLLLMVLSICFTIIPNVRNREFDAETMAHWTKTKDGYYQNLIGSVMLSIGVVLISLLIMVFKCEPYIIFEIIITPLGTFLFTNMIITCVGAFTVTFSYFKQ